MFLTIPTLLTALAMVYTGNLSFTGHKSGNENLGYALIDKTSFYTDPITFEDLMSYKLWVSMDITNDSIYNIATITTDTGPTISNRVYVDFNPNLPQLNYACTVRLSYIGGDSIPHIVNLCERVPLYRPIEAGYHYYGNYDSLVLTSKLSFEFYFYYLDQTQFSYFEGAIDDSFKEGYDLGYINGNNEGYDSGYYVGYNDGYNSGVTATLNEYYDSRYQQGYQDGYYNGASGNTYTFAHLFGAVADTPIMILRNLLGFEVFGVSAMTILMSMITGVIALFLIRKFF